MSRKKKGSRSAFGLLSTVAAIAVLTAAPVTANATIHEMVAAFCSGGSKGKIDANGFLEPPGVSDPVNHPQSFAKPVIANGVVVGTFPNLSIGTSPAAKWPQGTNPLTLLVSASNHPSKLHCPKAANLP